MNNTPVMKIGIVAVSRDCFPESLSVTRRQNLVKAYDCLLYTSPSPRDTR